MSGNNGRLWLNLGLLLVVAGLGTGAYLRQQKNSAPKPKLLVAAPQAITSAEIAWANAPKILLQKTGSDWHMTAPVDARVDPFEILSVSNLASTEVQEPVSRDGLVLKDLGLDPPERVIRLNGTAIAFGGTEPINDRRYVQIGEKVMLIDDPASPALDKDYHDLISKQLLAAQDQIIGVELPGGQRVQQDAKGQWLRNGVAIDGKVIQKWLAGWKAAKAQYHELAESPSYGDRVVLHLKSGARQEYVVAAIDPQLSLYSESLRVRHVLSHELVDTLLKLPEDPSAQPSSTATPAAAASTTPPSISEGLKLSDVPAIPSFNEAPRP